MANTTNFNWETPDDTDLVKDGAAAIRTLGNAIDTSLVDLKGGTSGQVLSKNSNTDMDFVWVTSDDANAIQNAIVDAKGDLISATAADTPARLAVGSNGDTLVADSAATTGLRWQSSFIAGKNSIINGGMDIWQRGTSFTTSNNQYTADRLQYYNNGANFTVSRQTSTAPTGFQYYARWQRNSGSTSTTASYLGMNLESSESIKYADKSATFSFYARAGANYSGASSNLAVNFSSGTGTDQNNISGSFTGASALVSSTVTLTTSWQRFSFTVSVGSTATQLGFYWTFTGVGTAGANDYVDITGIQLELGSVATQFSRAGGTLQGELAACQRYFQIADITNGSIGAGAYWSTTVAYIPYSHKVSMRTAPAITYSSVSVITVFDAGSTRSSSSCGTDTITKDITELTATTGATTAGRGVFARISTAGGSISFSSEL